MPHVVVVGRIHPAALDLLRARPDVTFEEVDEHAPEAIMAAMPRSHGIVVRTAPITAAMIATAPQLRAVSKHGVGWDNIDGAALAARGIPLTIAATANMVAVAEHALFMMLELLKLGREHDRAVREGGWDIRNRFAAGELFRQRLLLLGFGRIGREVARRALAFEMTVAVSDPYVAPDLVRAQGCELVSDLDAALAEADVVSLHLPLTAETRAIIDGGALGRMKPGAILINTARGGLVDEAALVRALVDGRLRGAGLDVFEHEPPAADDPLLRAPNLLLSPHSAGVTGAAAIRMGRESVLNLLAAFDGRLDPGLVVNGVRI
ncbi:MAG TPA: hydroxyacid dehydrogenase [Geminicoccaceae bacterium]|nr:hydroxyacid dehydrogenase [Geminicoccaceae bacterium]